MPMVMSERHGNIHIPPIANVAAFWRWRDRVELPEKLHVHFIRGEVWVDLSMEELFAHNQIKVQLGIVLGTLIESGELGMYVPDGMSLSNPDANLVTVPDAMFLSNESMLARRVRFAKGKKSTAKATRIVGSPDLVVEIISPNSVDKDTEWLMSAYHNAGITEYWLIDARDENDINFDIYRRGTKEFAAAKKSDRWIKSPVLGKSFRLTSKDTPFGYPQFKLEVR
jgi:Uma2 family endonuclease